MVGLVEFAVVSTMGEAGRGASAESKTGADVASPEVSDFAESTFGGGGRASVLGATGTTAFLAVESASGVFSGALTESDDAAGTPYKSSLDVAAEANPTQGDVKSAYPRAHVNLRTGSIRITDLPSLGKVQSFPIPAFLRRYFWSRPLYAQNIEHVIKPRLAAL
jgi:hypothetical protein